MPRISEMKRNENKSHLISVARGLFEKNGYAKTSVNDIVRNANISKGGFYTYYSTKESLFFDMINGEDQKIIHHGRKLTETNQQELLSSYIEYRLRRYLDEENRIRAKYIFEFWASTDLTPEQLELMNKRYENFEQDITRIIEVGQKMNIYRLDILSKHVIHILLSTIDGLVFSDTVLHRRINEEVINTTVEIYNKYMEKII
jgi:AcrR family transcriptional regulator